MHVGPNICMLYVQLNVCMASRCTQHCFATSILNWVCDWRCLHGPQLHNHFANHNAKAELELGSLPAKLTSLECIQCQPWLSYGSWNTRSCHMCQPKAYKTLGTQGKLRNRDNNSSVVQEHIHIDMSHSLSIYVFTYQHE